MQENTSRLLIGIEALFDLRLGTIARIDVDKAAGFLHDLNYSSRHWDKFPGVDEKRYEELYAKFDALTLSHSQTTAAVGLIHDHVKRCAKTSFQQPVALTPEVHINFWPMELAPEQEDLIVRFLQRAVPLKPVVKKVRYDYDQLNPLFVRATYKTLVMYDGAKWLEHHKKTDLFQKYPCPDVVLYAPLLVDRIPEGKELPPDWKEQYFTMSIFSQPFINIFFITIDNFCSYLSRKQPIDATVKPDEIKDEVEGENKSNT